MMTDFLHDETVYFVAALSRGQRAVLRGEFVRSRGRPGRETLVYLRTVNGKVHSVRLSDCFKAYEEAVREVAA